MKKSNADEFLRNMTAATQAELPSQEPTTPAKLPQKKSSTRNGLKHIGGYLDGDTVEKVAILRARLGLDNSSLIKLAVEDLHRKHMAKRAFGEA